MPAAPKALFRAEDIRTPHCFPYRVYRDPEALGIRALAHGRRLKLARGERLTSADHEGDCFMVASGTVASYICEGASSTLSAYYTEGSMFLELSALARIPSHLEYCALDDVDLIRIAGTRLKDAMMADPAVFDRIVRSICRKTYAAREQQRGAKTLDVRERVYLMLLGLAKDRGRAPEDAEDGWIDIDWKITQQSMGEMLGVNRVTVNTALQGLYEADLVARRNGRYCVRDAAGMLDGAD